MSLEKNKLRLSGLDGLRGISILLVIMCHSNWTCHLHLPAKMADYLQQVTFPLGFFGVPIFFVISGFLITYLLLREEERTGSISLKQFWIRRFLRIVPPVALYILFIFGYSALKGVHLDRLDLAAVVLFFRNLVSGNVMFDHFWSLSIEEQFYLAWPLGLTLMPGKWRFQAALTLLVLFPLLRIMGALLLSQPMYFMLTSLLRFDSILVGCLLAIGWDRRKYASLSGRSGDALFITGLISTFLAWVFSYHYGVCPNFCGTIPVFRQLMQEAATIFLNLGIACILISLVTESTRIGAFINQRWLTSIGLISYSLYLWQQFFFFAPSLPHWMYYLPVRILLAFGVATGGYYLVERPLTRLRKRIRVN
jgi:peptidoglycan/LPS O-acetylase OafA/YrhL